MTEKIHTLTEDVSESPLYNEHLAPVPPEKRTWNLWNLAAIWIGMAVCIPTYILASYMIKSGLSWQASLVIIGLANLIITVPMVLNGHAGVKYGVPFPVLGRASFGTNGIHIASLLRAIVACGWFGVQTWIGGLAFYAIWNALTGSQGALGLDVGKFIGFGVFWAINLHFIWYGTEHIKWLESLAAPILVLIGILLIIWGSSEGGGFATVLKQGKQLESPAAILKSDNSALQVELTPLKNSDGSFKAEEYQISFPDVSGKHKALEWSPLTTETAVVSLNRDELDIAASQSGDKTV
ncbi:MAG: hypothetical protein DWQ10_13210, partial [Calditrichaeota bacterium]